MTDTHVPEVVQSLVHLTGPLAHHLFVLRASLSEKSDQVVSVGKLLHHQNPVLVVCEHFPGLHNEGVLLAEVTQHLHVQWVGHRLGPVLVHLDHHGQVSKFAMLCGVHLAN